MESQSPDSDASVDESLFALLLDLGIPEAAARRALALTGGHSAEAAAQLYFSSGLDSQDEDEAQGSDVNLLPSRHHKMVFVVNMELSMGTGKIAAQVGHAAIGLFQLVQEKPSQRGMINQWDEHGAKKVVLQGVNTDQLLELHALALSLELPTYLVQDAGRTQIYPHSSAFVMEAPNNIKMDFCYWPPQGYFSPSWVTDGPCHHRRRRTGESGDRAVKAAELRCCEVWLSMGSRGREEPKKLPLPLPTTQETSRAEQKPQKAAVFCKRSFLLDNGSDSPPDPDFSWDSQVGLCEGRTPYSSPFITKLLYISNA